MSDWIGWSRRPLLVLAVTMWVLFAWLATHKSLSPVYFGRYSSEYLFFLVLVLVVALGFSATALVARRPPERLRSLRMGPALILLLVSSVVTLLVTEAMVRGLDLFGASFFQEVTGYMLDLVADEHLVYKHRPNFQALYQGVSFETNELGLRERSIAEKAADSFRILFLGDSVTLGWGVPVEKTFSRQVELELAGRSRRKIRTINSGVSGYNTVQELQFLRTYADPLSPDLIVLVYVDNDMDQQYIDINELRERWFRPPGGNQYLLRWSWLYRIAYIVGPHLIWGAEADRNVPGWQASMNALVEINNLARQRDIPFVTFLFRMTANPLTDALHQDLAEVSKREGFPYVDMLPWFQGVDIRSIVNSFIDVHPNSNGHTIMAEGISRVLADVIHEAP